MRRKIILIAMVFFVPVMFPGCQWNSTSRSNLAGNIENTSNSEPSESNKGSVQPANFDQSGSGSAELASNSEMTSENSTSVSSGTENQTEKIDSRQSLAESILFQPVKYPHGFDRFRIEGQQVEFESEDGTQLDGRIFRAVRPKGIILFCHGNGDNLTSRTKRMQEIKDRYGYSVFLFDYRGYGRSDGNPTVSGVLADGRAAVRKAAEIAKVDPSQVIIMGRSLGGAVAIHLAHYFRSPKLIVESSFTSFRDVAKHHVKFLSVIVPKTQLPSEKTLAKYRGQVMISHGTKDKVVPLQQGQRLFAAANEPKAFFEIKGAGHNDAPSESYKEAIGKFLAR